MQQFELSSEVHPGGGVVLYYRDPGTQGRAHIVDAFSSEDAMHAKFTDVELNLSAAFVSSLPSSTHPLITVKRYELAITPEQAETLGFDAAGERIR